MKNRGHPSLKSVPAEVVIERESTVYPQTLSLKTRLISCFPLLREKEIRREGPSFVKTQFGASLMKEFLQWGH